MHISSQAAAGPSPTSAPINEEFPPHPLTTYGRSKLRAEEEARLEAERIDALEKEIEAAVLPVDIRLGRALLLLAQRFGESEKRGWQLINLDLGQIDLAGIIGATRATTTHALTSLRQKGLVEGTRGRYWIRREDPLAWVEDSGG